MQQPASSAVTFVGVQPGAHLSNPLLCLPQVFLLLVQILRPCLPSWQGGLHSIQSLLSCVQVAHLQVAGSCPGGGTHTCEVSL